MLTKTTLLIPQLEAWPGCAWDVWIDGRRDDQLSSGGASIRGQSFTGFSALLVGSKHWPPQGPKQLLSLDYLDSNPELSFDIFTLGSSELPDTWLAYTGLSIVAAQAEKLNFGKTHSLTVLPNCCAGYALAEAFGCSDPELIILNWDHVGSKNSNEPFATVFSTVAGGYRR